MSLPPLPMTVIAGYLGAGKTTLINRLLAEDHGLRLMVLVNDFGAINIDADLLESAEEDTLTLSNGCVCCTMGADLFLALGDALDRRPRPDHLVVEASGIARPAQIANAAVAEPDMLYAGVVTVVDALNYPALASDAAIGPQIRQQVAEADLLLVSKAAAMPEPLAGLLAEDARAGPLLMQGLDRVAPVILGTRPGPTAAPGHGGHPAYAALSAEGRFALSRAQMVEALAARPAGLYRVKGILRDPQGGGWQVHAVGGQVDIRAAEPGPASRLVAIGLRGPDWAKAEAWWRQVTGACGG